jgi:CheY-like chemotaxis protein
MRRQAGTGWKHDPDRAKEERMIELKMILLVEDSPNDVELILIALAGHRLVNEVAVVRDGEEALDYLYRRGPYAGRTAGNPAVILLDLKLPKVNGTEVLRQIRSDDYLRQIPVVILTSSQEEADRTESYELGVNAYVVKPIDFHSFVDAVRIVGAFWAVVNEPPPGCVKKRL